MKNGKLVNSSLAAMTIAICASCVSGPSNPHTKNEDKFDRGGQYAEPADIWGVNFLPGKPSSTDHDLIAALASPRDKKALENDLAVIVEMPDEVPLRVVGHTDTSECTDDTCVELSTRRANLLNEWLVQRGVPRSRLSAPHGFGSTRSIGDNQTDEGRAANRRAYVSYEGEF